MNLIKMAVVFVIISLPFYIVSDVRIQHYTQQNRMKEQYTTIISNAVDDGTLALRLYGEAVYADGDVKRIDVDPEEVLETFLASYDYGFNAFGEGDKLAARQYILGIIIIGYDGYYTYCTQEIMHPSGGTSYRQVLSGKKPYVYREGHTSVRMTLGDEVTVISMETDSTTGEVWPEIRGPVDDSLVLAALPPGLTDVAYDSVRRQTITAAVEAELQSAVARHNAYTGKLGMDYVFHLPLYDNDTLGTCVSDISLLAFVQGQNLGGGRNLDMSLLNQASVMVGDRYTGYEETDPSGGNSLFYFCHEDCTHDHINAGDGSLVNLPVAVFANEAEAASKGYWPCGYVGR